MRSIGGFLFVVLRLENTDLLRVYVWVRVCGCLGNRWKEKERERKRGREREGERIKAGIEDFQKLPTYLGIKSAPRPYLACFDEAQTLITYNQAYGGCRL